MVRAEPLRGQLVLVLEGLAADAVEACVDVLVDVAVVVHPLQEVLDEALVPVIARADEEVGRGIEPGRQLAPGDGDAVGVLLRLEPLLLRDPPDLRRVLVDAGEIEGLVAPLAMVAHDHVADRGRVRVTDVRRRVDVVDRRGQVEAHPSMIRTALRRAVRRSRRPSRGQVIPLARARSVPMPVNCTTFPPPVGGSRRPPPHAQHTECGRPRRRRPALDANREQSTSRPGKRGER